MMNDQNGATGRQMTRGEQIVGVDFNPGGMESVNEAKALCARLIDLLHDQNREQSPLSSKVLDAAEMEVLKAQMMVVKALTFKH